MQLIVTQIKEPNRVVAELLNLTLELIIAKIYKYPNDGRVNNQEGIVPLSELFPKKNKMRF